MTKRSLMVVGVAGLALAAMAWAQDAAVYDGKWRGMFSDKKGRSRQAELAVSGKGGTWSYAREGGKWDDACMGPEFPVVVLSSSPVALKLRIDGESVLKGCGERVVVLKPGDDGKNLVGTFADNGREVKFTRR